MKKVFLLLLSLLATHLSAYHTPFFSPLYIAASKGDIKEVKRLVEQGADVNEHNRDDRSVMWGEDWYNEEVGLTPIYGAIGGKNREVINFLIAHGANLNTASTNQYWKNWPLVAAAENMPEMLETLIGYGAHEGYAQALRALVYRNAPVEILRKVLTYREKLLDETVNKDILSNLLIAASSGDRFVDLNIIKLLVTLGADVQYSADLQYTSDRREKRTALHLIAETYSYWGERVIQNKIEIAQFLISQGASLHAKDQKGRTPVDLAREQYSHNQVPSIIQALS